jgi:hypothetical protein
MEALSATLQTAHAALSELERDPAGAVHVVTLLEDAGAQLGYLQVACCTPARTKLYSESLRCLGRTQRLIKRSLDIEHQKGKTPALPAPVRAAGNRVGSTTAGGHQATDSG